MIRKFVKTTWKLWMDVPGKPPLWQCAAVAWLVVRAPKTNKIGSIDIDELVDWESKEETQCVSSKQESSGSR